MLPLCQPNTVDQVQRAPGDRGEYYTGQLSKDPKLIVVKDEIFGAMLLKQCMQTACFSNKIVNKTFVDVAKF